MTNRLFYGTNLFGGAKSLFCVQKSRICRRAGRDLEKSTDLWRMNQLFHYLNYWHQQQRPVVHIVFWVIIYGAGMIFDHAPELTTSQHIVLHLMMAISRIPIAYWVSYVVVPMFFDRKQYVWAILLFLVVYYLNFCLSTLFKIEVYPHFDMYVVSETSEFSPVLFFKNYFISNLGAAGFMVLVKLLVNRTVLEYKAIMLEKQQSAMELKHLKTQLNPHFLFNTLNNIYTLSLLHSPKTPVSIARLSEMLDYMLYRCNGQTVLLSQEVKLLENYIALEQLRYDERLEVTFKQNINQQAEIAPLILLTLVENAFKHGASEDMGHPRIAVELTADHTQILFSIENSILPTSASKQPNVGIGLKNLRQQLDLIYGSRHVLEITPQERSYHVSLKIKI